MKGAAGTVMATDRYEIFGIDAGQVVGSQYEVNSGIFSAVIANGVATFEDPMIKSCKDLLY